VATYSEEEIAAFKKKDDMYMRQTASNCTSLVFEGKEIESEVFIEYAQKIYSWLKGQDNTAASPVPTVKTEPPVDEVPIPQLSEKNLLDIIASKLDMLEKDIRPEVYRWAKTKYNCNYPTKIKGVDLFLEWYKNERKS